jgi:hypothetical protein
MCVNGGRKSKLIGKIAGTEVHEAEEMMRSTEIGDVREQRKWVGMIISYHYYVRSRCLFPHHLSPTT